jgi:hypothetical protein
MLAAEEVAGAVFGADEVGVTGVTGASGVLVVNSTPAAAAFCRSCSSSNRKISSRFASTGMGTAAGCVRTGAVGGGRSSSTALRHHANPPITSTNTVPIIIQRIIHFLL